MGCGDVPGAAGVVDVTAAEGDADAARWDQPGRSGPTARKTANSTVTAPAAGRTHRRIRRASCPARASRHHPVRVNLELVGDRAVRSGQLTVWTGTS